MLQSKPVYVGCKQWGRKGRHFVIGVTKITFTRVPRIRMAFLQGKRAVVNMCATSQSKLFARKMVTIEMGVI
jgi:hypothetical protein